jgi:hypothetical protein
MTPCKIYRAIEMPPLERKIRDIAACMVGRYPEVDRQDYG